MRIFFVWYTVTVKQLLFRVLLLVSLLLNRWFVVSVPDGDSLQLKDGRRIRLLGIDAPEKGRCLSQEARELLGYLAKGKHVILKDIQTDDYGRVLANVFVGKKWVNGVMVQEGMARGESSAYANEHKLGIYSETCRKTVPPKGCGIKGNIREGKSVYYLPICKYYNQVIVDEAFGDQWFCKELEAKEAGFTFAPSC